MIGRSNFLTSLLFFVLLMCVASFAHAGEFCVGTASSPSPFGIDENSDGTPDYGIIDGSDPATVQYFNVNNLTQITIDGDCTFRNWDPLNVTLNFQTNDPSIYLITFDNVNFTGNMACANIDHKFWVVNSPVEDFSFKCQDLFIPVEAIAKQVPAGKTTVGIGEVFTYTLTIPVLYDPALGIVVVNDGSLNDLHSIVITDDLNETGVDLTRVGAPTVEWAAGSSLSGPISHNFTDNAGVLAFEILPNDPNTVQAQAGDQIEIKITVSVDDTNVIGTQFFNTARWKFGRVIFIDRDSDGIEEPEFFDPLPGENGVSEILTIGAPDLTVTKSSPDTALNIGVAGTFTIDVLNSGNTDAWSPTVVDILPDVSIPDPPNPDLVAGMCDVIPSNITVGLFEADGTTPAPSQPVLGDDYTITFDNSTTPPDNCTLTIVVDSNGTNSIVIEPGQRLIITYNAELDADTDADGVDLTNVAGATQWFSANPGGTPAFITFNPGIDPGDPGTPGVIDNQDTHTVTTGLSGYFFTKTVENISTGEFPASSAVSGDTLRYTLRIFNVDQTITAIEVTDDLSSSNFNATTFNEVSSTGVASAVFSGGILTLIGNDLTSLGDELIYVFDINVANGLANGTIVSNQAKLDASGIPDGVPPDPDAVALSDDPFVNGTDDPLDNPPNPEATDVIVAQPGPLLKTDGPVAATIGDEITYRVTVPETPVATPLYDVRILDNLVFAEAELEFVSATVISGGGWTLTNTGTGNNLVIEDVVAGIDIPAGGQAVIDITVRVANVVANQIGDTFANTATYTFNRVNNIPASEVPGSSDTSDISTVITEPGITTVTKTANNISPTAGETVRYSVTLTAANGANVSDVFDVVLTDLLDLGLVYVGNPTVSTGGGGGSGVGNDNSITDPDVTGDGVTTQQLLTWSTVEADIDIDAGETVTIEYDVLVLDSVLANQILNNSIIVQWTGIDGINNFERSGIDGPGGTLNDYAIGPVVETLTTDDIVTTIDKVRTTDTFGAGDDDVRIGDIVEYTLTIPVPEGTLGNLQIIDTLPQGLDFEGVVSINTETAAPYAAVAPFTYIDIPGANIVETGDPAAGPTTVTWTLGDITNQPNDASSDDFVIVYRARVLNGDVLPQQDSTVLNNTVTMSYDTATGTVNSTDNDTAVTVLQPNLAVTKSASPDNGDALIDAGELITYTVDIINSGTAPAYDTTLVDIIPLGLRQAGVITTSIVRVNTATNAQTADPADFNPSYDVVTGTATWNFDDGATPDTYTIPPGETLRITYTVTADAGIAQGLTLINAATATIYFSFDDDDVPMLDTVSGAPEDYGPTNTATTTLFTGSPPTKTLITPAPASPEATIGEIVEYQITVPGTASASSLFDVQITDTLDANLEFINASIVGGIGVTDNSTANPAPSVLNVSVNEIAAGTQVVINLQARVRNVATAQQGTTIDNTVSYTYAFTSGGPPQPVQTSAGTPTVTLIEPAVAIGKNYANVSNPGNPPTAGDTLRYTLSLSASGAGAGDNFSDAFDISIIDNLSLGLAYQPGTFSVDGAGNTIIDPAIVGDGTATAQTLTWQLADATADIDITEGATVTVTYDVIVLNDVLANQNLTNSAVAQWTGIDGIDANERTGTGTPVENDYFTAPATTTVTTPDNTALSKAVIDDSFAPNNDSTVRVADTVTYELSLNLQEGTTRSVAVTDVLQAGLEFVGIVSINGDSTADYAPPGSGAGSNFSYATVTAASLPAAGDTGALAFTLGDVVNDPLGDATTDTLLIVYQARVAENTIVQTPTTTLSNTATLSYIDVNGIPVVDPTRLEDTASVTVLQPVMTVPTKVDAVYTSGAPVNVVTDTMQFTVESCNTNGLAPAYDLQLTDVLPTQLNEASLTTPVVSLYDAPSASGGVLLATLNDGINYNYTAPAARGGNIVIDMIDAIAPGDCITVTYDIGFYTDFGPDQTWSNSVTVDEYWSLPAASGQLYGPLGPTVFVMTNGPTAIAPPAKVITSPASGEATIGEQVVYQITVPSTLTNAALYDIVITDTLHPALTYISAVDISGNGLLVTNNTSGNNVNLGIATIPAGQQAVIELTARVANNASANAGTSFFNTVSYTFADSPGGTVSPGGSGTTPTSLLIVEPELAIGKAVANVTSPGNPPTAGDTLRYTLSLSASGAGAGDNFSDAFDISIIDNLSLGLAYQPGTFSVDGAGNTIIDPAIVGDGTATAQTLTWQLADATADIDITEGATVNITYDVIVLNDVLAGQDLTNSAVAQWTGLDNIDANERTGTGTPVENDYFTAPATTTVTTPDNTALTKSRLTDTFGALDTDVRIGDIVEYQVAVVLPEGQSNSVVVTDTLPPGMAFEEVASINGDTSAPFSSVAPFTYNNIAPVVSGDPTIGPSTVSFTLGDVVNAGDNNPANDTFVIVYRVRLLDNVFNQVDSIPLANAVQLDYINAGGPQTQNDSVGITLLQPTLTVSKTAAPALGDAVIVAGETVTYTVDIFNGGTAPAYDVVVDDIIPDGMRVGGVTMISTQLPIGNVVANASLNYVAATGAASWNFDDGTTADTYTILPGQILRIVYQVQADAGLGAGRTLTNQAVASVYYSLDDDAIPNLGGATGVPEIYGPSNTATTTLTTGIPGALLKQTPFEITAVADDQTVAVGETFSYTITVPETPFPIALHDVRILDDLMASAADLSFVSVSKLSGSLPWTPANTGTATSLVIEDTSGGIDIPANEQIVIEITVQVADTATNVSGLTFNNTATYTYNQLPDTPGTQQPGLPDTSGDMFIIGPDILTLTKSGPATMRVGVPETFTLTVHNDNTSGNAAPAWDLTVTDVLPDIGTGGMCDTAPVNIIAGIYQDSAGTLLVSALTDGVDYTTSYSGCKLSITMQSANAALPVNNYLIVTYDAALDADTPPNSTLTNIAGATQWFSNDTAGAGATGETRTFTEVLSNGTVGTLDHEDAHTLTTEAPVISFEKTVFNVTTGQPGANASPGDTLQYTIRIENTSDVDLPDFTFIDELDALNTTPAFAAATLVVTNAGGGDASATNANGGANGTGLVSISNLSLAPQTSPPGNVVTIVFEVTLAPVITSGTVVLNQGQILAPGVNQLSDDPGVGGATDPTGTLITSAPLFRVQKTSQDMTGDPAVLLSGDTLRYTITVKNIGNENAVNVRLQDQLPANTTYVAGSTTLNGALVADGSGGTLPLISGILINAPEDTTPGAMRADVSATTTNVATIVFDVVINNNVVNGTIISNQAFVDSQGAGSGIQPQQPSDDPATTAVDDPTIDIVGNLPLVDAQKTVSIQIDNNSNGFADPGDRLRYTIAISNSGASVATGVTLVDAVPANTTYVTGSTTLNGTAVADASGGVSPLIAGIDVSSSDLTPPLPTPGNGTLTASESAVIIFDVDINAGVAVGTIISNQGMVDNDQLPAELTDADGIDGNGDQPTDIIVGNAQLLSIIKEVSVVGGGLALAGGQLEYRIRVTNIGSATATSVVVTDNLDLPVAGQLNYVAGSGTLNGLSTGISFAAPVLTATVGDLLPGATAEVRFRALINSSLAAGTTITNTGVVEWNTPTQTASDDVSIDVGATPGVANISGTLWHDVDYNNVLDSTERLLEGWTVEVFFSGQLLGSATTDSAGIYSFNGLFPNDVGTDVYELRFSAPGAGANNALLGVADSPFTNTLHRIDAMILSSGSSLPNLNLPIDPNGVVYDAVARTPVAGAALTMLNASNGNVPLPATCFDDPAQQNQVTMAGGYYKFSMNFSDPACNVGDSYVIQVTPPANGYVGTTSQIIPPALALTDPPFSVPACPGSVDDQLSTSPEYCEVQASVLPPPTSVAPRTSGTTYYMQFTLDSSTDPYTSQIFNNHIPVDPELGAAVAISKTSSLINVTRSQLVPYTITVNNTLGVPLTDMDIVDNFPAGFKYVADSARIDGVASEPVINGLQMSWPNLTLNPAEIKTIKMLLVVGSGVSEGEYVNRVQVINNRNGSAVSEQATATVRVIPDPTFDCTDVIGKVFADSNMNGYQDEGEVGIASARVVTARGLEAKSDKHGRFHITCAVVPNEDRGSNFILKLDERSLPTGYRMTTENPRVERATRGKMLKFNFGAAIHRVVRLDMADPVFEPDSTEIRPQWISRVSLLMEKLVEAPSVLRLAYMADVEEASLVEDRLEAVKEEIERRWADLDCCYKLEIETEIFWRLGKPADKGAFK